MADQQGVIRKLAAILYADVAGYSRLTGADEEGTHRTVADYLDAISGMVSGHGGKVVHYAGDAVLADFGSVVAAVKCAIEVQKELGARNADIPDGRKIQFRIGINLGDVIVDRDDIYGNGVNVAARLENLADVGGICISQNVLDEVEGKVDVSFEDMGSKQVKNIAKPVQAYRVVLEKSSAVVQPPLLPEKPSIAVLPFANLSGDPEQEYFSDGIVEDITTELSRFRELSVIARNSSFHYKGRAVDIRTVGRELGVRYVLEGSIRRDRHRLRIAVQLIDVVTGAHRWAERYDRDVKDIFAVQEDVAHMVAPLLAVHVGKAEAERTLLKPPTSWQAHDYYLRALTVLDFYSSSSSREDLRKARLLLQQAFAIDPNYARAHAALSMIYVSFWVHRWDDDYPWPEALGRAYQSASKAVQQAANLPEAHVSLGWTLLWMRQHETAIAAFERAIALNPNFTNWRYAFTLAFSGEPARAIQTLEAHMRLDPFYESFAPAVWGLACYMLGHYAEALSHLQESVSRAPNMRAARVWLTATYGQLGEVENARAEAAEVLRIDPCYTITGTPPVTALKRPEDIEHISEGLQKAGLPAA